MAKRSIEHVAYGSLMRPEDEQYRMSRLSVFNWGTFSKRHTVAFAWDGHLIVGASGAGKSTLQDAISAMLVPPLKVRFNAAAEEGEGKGRDRSLMSYIRGAWADKSQEGSRETAKEFLRQGATWSAIALEHRNPMGQVVTLVRVFWFRGAGTTANRNDHFMVIQGEFDLAQLSGFDGERRTIKEALKDPRVRHHDNSFASYQEHWCRLFGIDDPSALELLHKAQSTKSLGDLNAFLRDFMLNEPDTFEKAQALIDEFVDLEEAHRAVVTAREQIGVLRPARDAYGEFEKTTASIAASDALIKSIPAFRYSLDTVLLEQELDALTRDRAVAQGECDDFQSKQRTTEDRVDALRGRTLELGGRDVTALERDLEGLVAERERKGRALDRVEGAVRELEWVLPTDAGSFVAMIDAARGLIAEDEKRQSTTTEERTRLDVLRHEQANTFRDLRDEVDTLEKNPSSIPKFFQDLRDRICSEVGIAAGKVAFVGELLQVRESEQAVWAPAAEGLLRSFATDLLIEESDYRKVARWVNDTNLRGKLTYHPVAPGQNRHHREPRSQDSIFYKLETKKGHAFAPWVLAQLAERFDYDCVMTAAELVKGERRITPQGQISHARRRTVKDDTRDYRDRANWILGFDNREKLARVKALAASAASDLASTDEAIRTLEQHRQKDLHKVRAAQFLATADWDNIDVTSVVVRITQVEADIKAIRQGNPVLSQIEAELSEARAALKAIQTALAERTVLLGQLDRREPSLQADLDRARIEALALPLAHREALTARLPEGWAPTLAKTLEVAQRLQADLERELRALTTRQAGLAGTVTNAFAEFLRRWPEEAGALAASLPFAPDFFTKLQRIEEDGLPDHEARFLELLHTQSSRRLVELSKLISDAKREIVGKLNDINTALYLVPYNQDSYIEITHDDLKLPDVRDFVTALGSVVADQRNLTEDPSAIEARFDALKGLVTRLRTDDAWRALVLDVRRHVAFQAVERDRQTDREIETYQGSSGKSGGQRQKLTSTCLAAALRYKLGGVDGGVPSYGTVVLDEAFTKTDNEFTETAVKIFKELGFHLVVATPFKSIMTLEPYVGGATYVSIRDRHTSSVGQLEYDTGAKKLVLTEEARDAEEMEEAADDE